MALRGRLYTVVLLALVVSSAAMTTDPQRPVFHVMPVHDWCNDPNGPMYYNGHYHLFFQYNPTAAVWGDMHWGHAVSTDLAHWTHLPPALAPDMPYDKGGVFTGSVTIVDGAPVATYTCVGAKQLQCLAYPADLNDPLLVNWTKPAINPVVAEDPPNDVGGAFRDPTTAWQTTVGGEKVWAMAVGASLDVGGTTNGSATMYTSPDFKAWTYHGVLWSTHDHGGMWECPNFFPLGTSGRWVLKKSAAGQDWYSLGDYDQVKQKYTPSSEVLLYDYGKWYASKSFHDPKKDRQILWGWVAEEDSGGVSRGWASLQSLPRTLTIDTDLNLLLANPIEELQLLRNEIAIAQGPMVVESGSPQMLGGDSQQLEIIATFARPSGTDVVEFGVAVRASPTTSVRTEVTVVHQPVVGPLNNTDLPGGDYRDFSLPDHVPESQNVDTCRSACDAATECLAWTYVRAGDPVVPRCSLKASIPAENPNHYCVSGIKAGARVYTNRTLSGGDGDKSQQGGALAMKSTDTTVTLHIFVDHSIVETFAQNGRARITSRIYPTQADALGVAVFARGADVKLQQLVAWTMSPAFAS